MVAANRIDWKAPARRTFTLTLTIQGASHTADSWDVRTEADMEEFKRELTAYFKDALESAGSNGAWGFEVSSMDWPELRNQH